MKKRKWIYLVYLFLSLLCTVVIYAGGLKIVFFGVCLALGIFIGWNGQKVIQTVRDYRLALKINSLQFSAAKHKELVQENSDLKQEITALVSRMEARKAE